MSHAVLLHTDEDKRRIGATRGQRSMLKAVATAPFQLVRSGASLVAGAAQDGVASPRSDAGASGGVADQWCAALDTCRARILTGQCPAQCSSLQLSAVLSCLLLAVTLCSPLRRIDFLIQQAEAAQAEAETTVPHVMPANSNVLAQGAATPVPGSAPAI